MNRGADHRQLLALIPARGGSKGIPGKNSKLLAGKPLIQYTLEVASQIFSPEDICVSTDDAAIRQVVEDFGIPVPFMRPPELATDEAGMYEVLLHALQFYQKQGKHYDALVLLQPTSPLRQVQHVREAMQLFHPELDMVVSVTETKANPYYVLFEENAEGYLEKSKPGNFVRRQDVPKVYAYNGAVYVMNTRSLQQGSPQTFRAVRKYVMDEKRSLDLDTELDWLFLEFLLSRPGEAK
ncbi:MAG: cytidylyltransferase domain-containing protein [Saprospiraceae bacterium]